MEPNKLSGLLYIGAAAAFLFSGFLSSSIVYFPLSIAFIVIGIRKLMNK